MRKVKGFWISIEFLSLFIFKIIYSLDSRIVWLQIIRQFGVLFLPRRAQVGLLGEKKLLPC